VKNILVFVAVVLCVAIFGLLLHFEAKARAKERDRRPSKLEKTCPFEGAWVPCFIVDEAVPYRADV
jgi:hypothetical protein